MNAALATTTRASQPLRCLPIQLLLRKADGRVRRKHSPSRSQNLDASAGHFHVVSVDTDGALGWNEWTIAQGVCERCLAHPALANKAQPSKLERAAIAVESSFECIQLCLPKP